MTQINSSSGDLYIVATPIGNLNDISFRAIETLKNCDLIACEDTRHTRKLCHYFDISTTLMPLHQHNENSLSKQIIHKLLEGLNIALVSDAGTPLISDPGYPLVKQARENNINVIPIPGACALISLLCISGLSADNFTFVGFLPAKTTQRVKLLNELKSSPNTTIIYESSHRILASVQDMITVFGEGHTVALGRELTKKFETTMTASLAEIQTLLNSNKNQLKGEFVLAIEGKIKSVSNDLTPEHEKLATTLAAELPPKKAAKIVADHYDINKKSVYQYILDLSNT